VDEGKLGDSMDHVTASKEVCADLQREGRKGGNSRDSGAAPGRHGPLCGWSIVALLFGACRGVPDLQESKSAMERVHPCHLGDGPEKDCRGDRGSGEVEPVLASPIGVGNVDKVVEERNEPKLSTISISRTISPTPERVRVVRPKAIR